jgi:hypothetical protein
MTNGGPGAVASAAFSKTLIAVTSLTLLCLALWVGLAVGLPDPTHSQETLIEGISHAFTAGFGALLGLLGSKLKLE